MVYLRPVGHKSDALFTTLPSHLLCCIAVKGVTQLHDVVYIITAGSKAILRFNTTSHQRLSDIHMRDMREPVDIVACEQTSQFYVAMWSVTCVWRVSADGADIRRWLAESWGSPLNPTSLSMTSTRLLVMTCNPNQLIQAAMNSDVFHCRSIHGTPSSHRLRRLSSVTETQNRLDWSSIRSVKSTPMVNFCVGSTVHVSHLWA